MLIQLCATFDSLCRQAKLTELSSSIFLKELDDQLWEITRALCAEIELHDDETLNVFREDHFRPKVLHWCLSNAAVARLWAKPSGYSGDYLTIELLCQNQQSWAAVEDVFLNHLLRCEMADQHRAKVKEQAKLVSSVISRPNAKLINAGCGPCFDIRLALAQASTGEAEIVLIDLDANALAFAEEKLSSLPHNGVKFTFVRGDVFTALRHLSAKPSEAGTFDAVLFGGIFDYLPDRVISLLLRAARKLLKKSGEVLFSQVSTANPNRTFMKWYGDWELQERDEAHLLRLCQDSGFGRDAITFFREPHRIAIVARLTHA